ncbi:MAG: DUF2911 domain-containing protein [Chitinophagaceae bacterium]|nr:DUF2911 domain-containing protein [Chitinophagaceae bacterium]
MKKLMLMSVVLFTAISFSCGAQTPASPKATAEGKDVSVTYGQPSKKGREIFGKLEPFGKVWRAGANEATEITFAKDTKFGGKEIKAGTYTLFVTPNASEWMVILNSERKQWGAYKYEEIKAKDVLKVNVPVKKLDNVVEKLTYRFTGNNELVIEWDQTQATIPVG